jgi:hypothetical protein
MGLWVGIAGNQSAKAGRIFREMGLPADLIVTSADWGVAKPDPEFFRHVIQAAPGSAAIVAAITWALFIEQVILATIVPGIEKWLPTAAAIGLTDIPSPAHGLLPTTVGLVLAGYAIALLVAASRTTMRRDLA